MKRLSAIGLAPLLWGGLALLVSSCAGTKASGTPPSQDIPEAIRSMPPEIRRSLAKDAFLQALWLDLQGQDMMAVDYLQEAAWNDPDDRWLQFHLASRLREFRRSSEALSLARRALTLPGEAEPEQWGLLAGLWLEAGAKDSAKVSWERMLALDPQAREALVGLAALAEARGDLSEAAQRYSTLAEDYGDAARSIVARAVALWVKAGRLDSATSLLERRWNSRRDPEEGESLARLLSARGMPDSAVAVYDDLALSPDTERSRLRLMAARTWMLNGRLDSAKSRLLPLVFQGFTEAQISLGVVLLDLDSLDGAHDIFADLRESTEHGAMACHYLGVIASRRGQPDSARAWFDLALRRDPQRPDTWARRGLLELDEKLPDSALAIFGKMARLWPNSPQAHWLMAHALTRQAEARSTLKPWEPPGAGKDSVATSLRLEAIAHLDTSLRIEPNQSSPRFERAALLERIGLRDSSRNEFRRIVRHDTANASAANYLAYMLAEDSVEIDFADSLVERALAIDSTNPAFLDTRAWIRHRQGRHAEALVDIDRSIAEGEDDPVVLEHRAIILERLGRSEDAAKAWRTLLDKAPEHPRALRALGRTQ